jgi:hypothetical protein
VFKIAPREELLAKFGAYSASSPESLLQGEIHTPTKDSKVDTPSASNAQINDVDLVLSELGGNTRHSYNYATPAVT